MPVSDAEILFDITSGEGATLNKSVVTTDAEGLASVYFTSGPKVGAYIVKATVASGSKSLMFSLVAESPDDPTIEIMSGNFQVGSPDTQFSLPLVVRMMGAGGMPLEGEVIGFTISAGTGASLSAESVTTDETGKAQVNLTPGSKKNGTYIVTATNASYSLEENFTLFTETTVTTKVVKIVEAGAGKQSEIASATVDVASGSISMKAALFDFTTGDYIEDVSVVWATAGGGFSSADFAGTPSGAINIVFNPTKTGTTIIQATYTGSDNTVIGPTDVTESINVSTVLVPATINIIAGDAQSGVVNNNLATPLKVRVTTSTATPIPGVGVMFTSVQGGGSMITAQPVITDADGFAETTVKLSTVASGHIYRATVVSNGALTADFSATANAGAATKLALVNQPSDAFRAFKFLTQPSVVLRDQYDNFVSSSFTTVYMNVSAGTGTLSGTDFVSGVTTTGGVAQFNDLTYDTEESGVVLEATAAGLTSAPTAEFAVGPALVSACAVEDIDWKTEDGGCKDQSSGLVWSARAGPMSWEAASWDAFAPGANGLAEVEASDNGWTNEFTTGLGNCGGRSEVYCDKSPAAYCHDLVEGGQSDWRLPTSDQYALARANGANTHLVSGSSSAWLLTSTRHNDRYIRVFRMDNSSYSYVHYYDATRYVYCVRGGAVPAAATSLKFPLVSGLSALVNETFSISADVVDLLENQVNQEGVSVTISKTTGSGNLSGTLTKTTDDRGRVTFDDLSYDTFETIELTLSATGFNAPSVDAQYSFSPYPGGCGSPDSFWVTADGGCKEVASGNVWSANAPTGLSWDNAFWDADAPGANPPEASDFGRTNEYLGTSKTECNYGSSWCDNSGAGYCHDLIEGGFTDWRLPTVAELQGAYSAGIGSQHSGIDTYFWTRKLRYDNTGRSSGVLMTNGNEHATLSQGSAYKVKCIRPGLTKPAPTSVEFDVLSLTAIPNETVPTLNAQIIDAAGDRVYRSGVNVTVSAVGGTGTLSGTLTQTTNSAGVAVFDDLSYDTVESISISLTNDDGLTDGDDAIVNVSTFPGACLQDTPSFQTAAGGCQRVATGLVFSKISPTSYVHSVAQSYCADLIEAGYSDWRLPTGAEIIGVVGHLQDSVYISANTDQLVKTNDSTNRWRLFTGVGNVDCCGRNYAAQAVCVRP